MYDVGLLVLDTGTGSPPQCCARFAYWRSRKTYNFMWPLGRFIDLGRLRNFFTWSLHRRDGTVHDRAINSCCMICYEKLRSDDGCPIKQLQKMQQIKMYFSLSVLLLCGMAESSWGSYQSIRRRWWWHWIKLADRQTHQSEFHIYINTFRYLNWLCARLCAVNRVNSFHLFSCEEKCIFIHHLLGDVMIRSSTICIKMQKIQNGCCFAVICSWLHSLHCVATSHKLISFILIVILRFYVHCVWLRNRCTDQWMMTHTY